MLSRDDRPAIDFRHRLARDLPLVRRRGKYSFADGPHQLLTFTQLSEAERLLCRWMRDSPGGHDQRGALHLHLVGGQIDQQFSRSSRGLAQLRAHGGRRPAPEGTCVERSQLSVAHHQADGFERRAQLFRDSLGERGADVLADLDLSRVGSDHAVFADVKPCANLLRQRSAARTATRASGFLLGQDSSYRSDDEDAAAQHLEEVASSPARNGKPDRRPVRTAQARIGFRPQTRLSSGTSWPRLGLVVPAAALRMAATIRG